MNLALDTLISRAKVMKRTPTNIQAIGFKFLNDPTKEDAGPEPTEAVLNFKRISWDHGTEATITAKALQFKGRIQKVFKAKLAPFEAELKEGTQKVTASGSTGYSDG